MKGNINSDVTNLNTLCEINEVSKVCSAEKHKNQPLLSEVFDLN